MGRRAKWKPLELFKSNSEPKAALCLGKLCQLVLPGEAVSVREYTQCVPPRLTYSGTTVKHSLGQWQWQMSEDCCRGIAVGSHKTSASCGAEQWTGKESDSPSLWESAFIIPWISSFTSIEDSLRIMAKTNGSHLFRHLFHIQVFKKTSTWTFTQNNEWTYIFTRNAFRGKGLALHLGCPRLPQSWGSSVMGHQRSPNRLSSLQLPATVYRLLLNMSDLSFLLTEHAPGLLTATSCWSMGWIHGMDSVWPECCLQWQARAAAWSYNFSLPMPQSLTGPWSWSGLGSHAVSSQIRNSGRERLVCPATLRKW